MNSYICPVSEDPGYFDEPVVMDVIGDVSVFTMIFKELPDSFLALLPAQLLTNEAGYVKVEEYSTSPVIRIFKSSIRALHNVPKEAHDTAYKLYLADKIMHIISPEGKESFQIKGRLPAEIIKYAEILSQTLKEAMGDDHPESPAATSKEYDKAALLKSLNERSSEFVVLPANETVQ